MRNIVNCKWNLYKIRNAVMLYLEVENLRKIRWKIPGKGKRGGTRIIYCWFATESVILMLFVFKKNEGSDLDKKQLRILKNIVMKELQ